MNRNLLLLMALSAIPLSTIDCGGGSCDNPNPDYDATDPNSLPCLDSSLMSGGSGSTEGGVDRTEEGGSSDESTDTPSVFVPRMAIEEAAETANRDDFPAEGGEEGGFELPGEEGGEIPGEGGEEAVAGGEEETTGGEVAEEGGEAWWSEEEESAIDSPEACGGGNGIVCPPPPNSYTEVSVQQIAEGAPDAFTGGEVPSGSYELTKLVLYPGSMTANRTSLPVELSVQNNGTRGSAIFAGDAWGIQADLDLELDALGNIIPLQENLQGGGCFAAEGVTLAGDVTQCSEGEETSGDSQFTLPDSFDYNNNGTTVQLLLIFPVDALLAGLADQPAIANVLGALLVNDLQVVLEMEKVWAN